MIALVKGKKLHELVQAGSKRLASVPTGGAAVASKISKTNLTQVAPLPPELPLPRLRRRPSLRKRRPTSIWADSSVMTTELLLVVS